MAVHPATMSPPVWPLARNEKSCLHTLARIDDSIPAVNQGDENSSEIRIRDLIAKAGRHSSGGCAGYQNKIGDPKVLATRSGFAAKR